MIKIRVTQAEARIFDDAYCKTHFKSRADFLLALIGDEPIVIVENMDFISDLISELKRQGNTLNQIARVANSIGYVSDALDAAIDLNNQTKATAKKLVSEVYAKCRCSKEKLQKTNQKK